MIRELLSLAIVGLHGGKLRYYAERCRSDASLEAASAAVTEAALDRSLDRSPVVKIGIYAQAAAQATYEREPQSAGEAAALAAHLTGDQYGWVVQDGAEPHCCA